MNPLRIQVFLPIHLLIKIAIIKMDIIKRIIGVLCMLIAPYAAFLLTTNGIAKIAAADAANKTNATTQWSILIIIFLPVMAGLFIFGLYGAKGEYSEEVQ
jgi:hypothetical protein